MSEIERVLKDIVYAGVGAVTAVVEKGSEIARDLVELGRRTVEENQESIDAFKKSAQEFIDSISAIDVRALTAEERANLRRRLDEVEEELKAAAAAAKDNAADTTEELRQTVEDLRRKAAEEDAAVDPAAAEPAAEEKKEPEVPVLRVDEDDNEG